MILKDTDEVKKNIYKKVVPEKFGNQCNPMDVIYAVLQAIDETPTVFEWHDAMTDPPKKNGRYLVKHYILNTIYYDVVDYATKLSDIDYFDFEGKNYSGWYVYDSEWGFCEDKGVIEWGFVPIKRGGVIK